MTFPKVIVTGLMLQVTVAVAQVPDTVAVNLDPIVVTAERSESFLSSSTAGVSVLTADDLRALPTLRASSLLGLIPGMAVLDFDGLGYAPQTVARGFYGGGEAEYVVVLVNGKPLNNLENGLVNWEEIVTGPGTTVEVLRGGASSLYGDAAIGAVLNIRTSGNRQRARSISLGGGTLGLLSGGFIASDSRYRVTGRVRSHEGFRDHSARTVATLAGTIDLSENLSASASGSVRDLDTPGPLRSSDSGLDDDASLAFFRFDGAREENARLSLDGTWRPTAGKLSASLTTDYRTQDLVRTLPLSAEFADTQERRVDAITIRGTVQLAEAELPIAIENTLVVGADASRGTLDSRYNAIATGGLQDAYSTATGDRGDLLSEGTATRTSAAGYAHLELRPRPAVKVSVGGRFDSINDSFDGEGATDASHQAFSPKAGLNVRYAASPSSVGNVYVSASKSFKAPTLDQLYDLRAFPVPFPPFSIRIANDMLVPQEGTSFEAGFYHFLRSPEGWRARLSASAYTMDMTNEIDFSFETFSNVNIGKSRHRGLETALSVDRPQGGSLFANYTLQDVELQAGDNQGNKVKAVPRHALSAGLVAERRGASAGLVLKRLAGMWVDDANTIPLDGYTTLDLRAGYERGAYAISLDIYNALDSRYNSTAYPDPAGSDVLFVFPSAGRTLSLSLTLSL